MPGIIKDTEAFIESTGFFQDRKILLTGRGATSLLLLFELLGKPDGRVILPSIGCPSLLATTLLSGLKPVIVDVDDNLSIDPVEVDKIIRPDDIVLGVHLYGIPCEIEKLADICEKNKAILIEDAAQAIGGLAGRDNRPLGTFGRASILSFAGGKILDTVGGGGILTDDIDLYTELSEKISHLPPRGPDLPEKSIELRNILTRLFNDVRKDNTEMASKWMSILCKYSGIYKFSITDLAARRIKRSFDGFPEKLQDRIKGVRHYERSLCFDGFRTLNYPDGCVPFRFSFIAENLSGTETQKLTSLIRSGRPSGIHASNLYLPLHWLAPGMVETRGCPNAEVAGIRVINLWVNKDYPARDAQVIKRVISDFTRSGLN